jgi:parallel beta-helix repeat protein
MASYYVDSDVAGPGDGSFGDPWDDISSNINSLSAGDTMYLRGGSVSYQLYDETQISITVDGSSGNEITITPYQSELVEIQNNVAAARIFSIAGDYITIDGKNQLYLNKNDTNGYAVYVNSANVTIKDAEVANRSGSHNALVYFASGSSYGLIDGCEVHDSFDSTTTDSHGVTLSGSNHTTVQNCTIYDCYGDGVYIHDSNAIEGWSIINNTIYTTLAECSENGIDAKKNGSGTQATIRGNTLYGFYACPGTCGGSGDGDGEAISIHNTCDNVLIEDNIIYDCTSGIVVEDGVSDIVVQNNLIYDLHTEIEDPEPFAGQMAAFHIGCADSEFYNNTVHNAPVHSIQFPSTPSNVQIKNNIFNDCGEIIRDTGTGYTADYNCWYNCTDTLSSGGANDVTDDPLFNNEAGDDYTLASNSPCIDAGVDVGLDYNGSAPDMGYWESDFPAATLTPAVYAVLKETATVTVGGMAYLQGETAGGMIVLDGARVVIGGARVVVG